MPDMVSFASAIVKRKVFSFLENLAQVDLSMATGLIRKWSSFRLSLHMELIQTLVYHRYESVSARLELPAMRSIY